MFGQVNPTNLSVGIGCGQESAIAFMTRQFRERNEETKNRNRMREEQENREWRAKHGRTFNTIEPYESHLATKSPPRHVTFSDEAQFSYVETGENCEDHS